MEMRREGAGGSEGRRGVRRRGDGGSVGRPMVKREIAMGIGTATTDYVTE